MDSDHGEEEVEHSDGELDDVAHKKLMSDVLNLSRKQHVKKSTRTEPTLKVSEFDLVKTGKNVHIADLAGVLQRKGKQEQISKQIKRAEQKLATLPKPLEKPQAERIHRTVAYKKTQNELGKWDPIVSSIRSSTHTSFPLHSDSKLDEKVDTAGADWGYKNELQKGLDSIENKWFVLRDDVEFPITVEEMLEKRREAARMRAHESYKIAKARRQNKIKSKKYHRVQKKEKMKQKMKEFELLQKTNPEAALEKLEEIERARAEERMSLRHKSTGQWAKSKLVRAKYDKESRQVLAQQLGISRDLTQKLQKTGDSDSEPDDAQETAETDSSQDNPWLNEKIKVSKEVSDFEREYRKYWEKQNDVNGPDDKNGREAVPKVQENDLSSDESLSTLLRGPEKYPKTTAPKRKATDHDSNGKFTVKKVAGAKRAKISIAKPKVKQIVVAGTEWTVTEADDDTQQLDLDQEFDIIDNKLRRKVEQKYKSLKTGSAKLNKAKKNKNAQQSSEKLSNLDMLALPKENLRPVIDEELDETSHRGSNDQDNPFRAYDILKVNSLGEENDKSKPKQRGNQLEEIDPNKFIQMKPTKLNTAIPDLMGFEDNEDVDQRGVIAEAFQNDDVLDEFQKEKQDDIEANTPKSIDLSLPGWGAWGGKGVQMSARKKKRFIVKFPEKMKRKDSNKGHLIVNENANSKVRAHLVSEVPFPFKNVKDYEASIRAPIGSTFVPETAFRRLTKPAVSTKLGTVIEPMTKDILIKKKKK